MRAIIYTFRDIRGDGPSQNQENWQLNSQFSYNILYLGKGGTNCSRKEAIFLA